MTPTLAELKRLRDACPAQNADSAPFDFPQFLYDGWDEEQAEYLAYAANHAVEIAERLEQENSRLRLQAAWNESQVARLAAAVDEVRGLFLDTRPEAIAKQAAAVIAMSERERAMADRLAAALMAVREYTHIEECMSNETNHHLLCAKMSAVLAEYAELRKEM